MRGIFLVSLAVVLSGCQTDSAPARFDLGFDMPTLMRLVIEPAAEVPWDSAGEIVTAAGVEDLSPTSEEGWHHVESAGATLVESGNLLLLPGRDPGKADWQQFSRSLSVMGHRVMVAAQAQDKDALFEAGADLYQVCVGCHQVYVPDLQPNLHAVPTADTQAAGTADDA